MTEIVTDAGTWTIRFVDPGSRCLRGDDHGSSDPSTKRGKKWIYVSAGLGDAERLETLIHEILHVTDPRASEEAITDQAETLARALLEIGVGWVTERKGRTP